MRSFLLVAVVAVFACAMPACLLPGSDSVTQASNVELIVTGLVRGDRVDIDFAGSTFASDAGAQSTVHFFFAVTPGLHEGTLTVHRHAASLCASFTAEAPAPPARATTSVSVDGAATCDVSDAGVDDRHDAGDVGHDHEDAGPDDAGTTRSLVRLSEVTVAACGGPSCTTRTDATGEGVVTVEQAGATTASGVASNASKEALDALALSAAADALFAGTDPTCPKPTAPHSETVTLERTTSNGTDAVTETVDATGCTTGVAQQIRAQLASMRSEVGAP